jgi:hypothetical protein
MSKFILKALEKQTNGLEERAIELVQHSFFKKEGKKISEDEARTYLSVMSDELVDDLICQLEYFIPKRIQGKESVCLTKPDLQFKMKDGKVIKFLALNRDESFKYDHKHYMGDHLTAGLVTQTLDMGMVTDEVDLHNKGIWDYIQYWMMVGLASQGYIEKAPDNQEDCRKDFRD